MLRERLPARMLRKFRVSTKVGFFQGSKGVFHSLQPFDLKQAVTNSERDLGKSPEVVFLHNPERSLKNLGPDAAAASLADACHALEECRQSGACGAWGIATWEPASVVSALAGRRFASVPQPNALMFRVGLLVSAQAMASAEALADRFNLPASERWGMSPFGGSATDPAWSQVDARIFLKDPHPGCTREQAAFRVGAELPQVSRVAVGTNSAAHLIQLMTATGLSPDLPKVGRYREMLRAEQRRIKTSMSA